MKSTAAIIQPVEIERQDAAVDAAWVGYKRSREEWGRRRLALGEALAAVRGRWPRSGPRARGWGEYLAARGIDQDAALEAMAYAGYLEENPPCDPGNLPTKREAGIDRRPLAADRDGRPDELPQPVEAPSAGDRDSYCTPAFITCCLPAVDFDPCSNSRSTVRARRACWFAERGEDGLAIEWTGSGYWNVPYSRPLPWAEKFDRERAAITAAGWLVNTDQSTKWWSLLIKSLPLRLDFDDRIQFVAPPGVPPSSNDRPQTLLMDEAFWRGCDQAALLKMGTLWRRSGLEIVK